MITVSSHDRVIKITNFYDFIRLSMDKGIVSGASLTEDILINYHGRFIPVEKGFKWDGSSLPGGRFIKFGNRLDYLLASLAHDILYGEQPEWAWRIYADYIYGQLMAFEGAPKWQCWLRVGVLWAFGWKAWNNNKKGK